MNNIYNRDFNRTSKLIYNHTDIIPENRKLLRDFHNWLLLHDLTPCRACRYLVNISPKAKTLKKPFRDFDESDINSWLAEINSSNLSDWTKQSKKIALKRLFQFIANYPWDKYPECVAWLKPSKNVKSTIEANDLLTQEEVVLMLAAATNARDRAIISILYEAGLRVGELLTMRVKHVVFDPGGCYLIVPSSGKTGTRKVVIRDSMAVLTAYLNTHARRNDPEAPLWLSFKRGMAYAALRKRLKEIAHAAGIKKRVNPHNFRHSAATNLASGVSESILKKYFGWTMGSSMAAVYVHLNNADVDNAVLKARGVTIDTKQTENKLQPIKCDNCSAENVAGSKYCMVCNLPINKKLAEEIEISKAIGTIVALLNLDPEQVKYLSKRLEENRKSF